MNLIESGDMHTIRIDFKRGKFNIVNYYKKEPAKVLGICGTMNEAVVMAKDKLRSLNYTVLDEVYEGQTYVIRYFKE